MKRLFTILSILLAFTVTFTPVTVHAQTTKCCKLVPFSFDADAQAFFTATGITDPDLKTATNDLVLAAKAHGWWTECIAIYPYIGGTASTHKYNLKDPRDLDAAYRITFNGSWTHDANGIQGDGATNYGDTHIDPSTNMTINDTHISVWSNTNSAADIADIGVVIFPSQSIDLLVRGSGGTLTTDHYSYFERLAPAVASSIGWFLSDRTSSILCEVSKNGVSLASNTTTSGTLPNTNIYVGAISGTVGALPSNRQYWFHTVGYGIGISLAATMYADIAAFETAVR